MTVLDRFKLSLLVGLGVVLVSAGMAGNRRDVGILEAGLWAALIFTGLLNCLPALEVIQHTVERLTQRDIDGDGSIGEPEPIELPHEPIFINKRQSAPAFRVDRLAEFLRSCAVSTTVRSLRDAGFEDTEIDAYRKLVIEAGFGQAVNTDGTLSNGWRMIGSPERIMAEMIPPPYRS